MSQDVNDSSQSHRDMPIQLRNKSGSNGQRIIVLTPDMLNKLGIIDNIKLYQSEPKTENDANTVSPVKIDNTVKKIIIQKVLKSDDPSKRHVNNPNAVKKIITTQKSVKTAQIPVEKHNPSAIERIESESKIVDEKLKKIPKHNVFPNTSGTTQKRPVNAQSKKSTEHNGNSQIDNEKQGQKKSVATSPRGKNTSKKSKASSLELKNNSGRKSSQSSTKSGTISCKSTDSKLDTWLNKIPSTSNSSLIIHKSENPKKDKTDEKSSGIKSTQVALPLETNYSKSSKPSPSSLILSSHSKTLLSKKPQDIIQLPVTNHNIDKKLSSAAVVEIDDVNQKKKPPLSKPQSNVKVDIKTKQPAHRTSRRVSKPKVFDDCIYDVPNRRISIERRNSDVSNHVEQAENNVVDVAQVNRSDKKTKVNVKNSRENAEKITIKSKTSDIVKSSDKREKCKSQSQIRAQNNSLSSTSRTVEKPGNKGAKPRKQQSKIIHDNSKNSHDNMESKNEKNYVPETATMPEVPNTIPVLEDPTIKKGRGANQKCPSTDTITHSNAVIQKPQNKSSIIEVTTNGIENSSMSSDLSRISITKEVIVTKKKLNDEELCTGGPEDEDIESIYYIPKQTEYAGKKRGRPPKYFVIDQIAKSNSGKKNTEDESSIMQVTNGIDKDSITPNLGRDDTGKKLQLSMERLHDTKPHAEETKEQVLEDNNLCAQDQSEYPVKKRGRPRKKRGVEDLTEVDPIIPNPDTNPEPSEQGRSRRARKVDESQKEMSDMESGSEEFDNGDGEQKRIRKRRGGGCRGRRRGRRTLGAIDSEYMPRTAESNRKQKKKDAIVEKTDDIEVVCGKCTEKVASDKWINHNLHKHNNMGWREGDPVPDYENNEKLWRSVLSVAHKRKKGSLICEKCSTTKKSVFGFISHYRFCGKTIEERNAMKWICPQCNGVFMPSSQDVHERMHRDMEYQNKVLIIQATTNDDEVEGSRKRKAAERAATKISEFTAMVKDEEPTAKRLKLSTANINNLIKRSDKKNKMPTVWKGAWMKAIADNEPAQCRQPGCTFSTTTLSEIYDHYNTCKFNPTPTFTCKICKYVSEKMKQMKTHVKEQHANKMKPEDDSDFLASESSNESEVEEILMELPRNRKSTTAQIKLLDRAVKYEYHAAFLRNEKYCHEGNPKITFVGALRWTLEFELINYRSLVFENFKPNSSTLLTNTEAENYLPELTLSMRMQQLKSPVLNWEERKHDIIGDRWKTWNRFESSVIDGFPTFFVGGPVWSMAWLPIPTVLYSQNVDQYIAISTHTKMEDSFVAGKSYEFKNIIQIWNLGHLDNSLSHTPQIPKLVYAIAHEKGTIWSMEWCPSGAYTNVCATNIDQQTQNSSPRMGLLAVASSDGCVHIYSIAFPEKLNFKETDENSLPIYKTDPVVTLQVNQLYHEKNEINWQCTIVNWSKVNGHDTIAAGFSNGCVALWDLSTKSPLLVNKKYSTVVITSYRHFFAHKQTVTGITIIPLRGRRFLATVSIDRYAKFWDLENVSRCVTFVKKGMTVNSTWMTHWPNIIAAYDDVLGMTHTTSYMISLREPCSKVFPLLPTNSPSFGLAASDYANGIFHGTSAGELVAIFPFQMLYYRDLEREKLNRKRWLVSSVEIVDFENKAPEIVQKKEKKKGGKTSNLKEYIYMPETYEECSQRFGMIFHNDINNIKKDMTKKSNRKNPLNSDTMKHVPVEQYNFAAINRISWNPNAWSYLWVGVGYQNGFIRILHLKSMSMQNAMMKLLPGHVKKQLNTESEM